MLPEEVEIHRDRMWRRDPENRVEDVFSAERFHRSGRVLRGVDGFAPAWTVVVRRGLRASRRAHAAQRAEGSGEPHGVVDQGRRDAAREVFLWKGAARAFDFHRAAARAVLPCAVWGAAALGEDGGVE